MAPDENVTIMLRQARMGEAAAVNRLVDILYAELRDLAESAMKAERRDHTLQPTALVHEAYMRLIHESDQTWQNRTHFFASAASAIRRILIEHARRRSRQKRGGDARKIPLDDVTQLAAHANDDILALDECLDSLAKLDPQKARIVELRYFGGLTVEEVAAVLDVSESTIAREWRLARAWLRAQLSDSTDEVALT